MAKLVLTVGTFDTPHMGHSKFLYMASKLGDLMVGVNTDEYVKKYKGKAPIFTFEERRDIILTLPFVSGVVSNSEDDLKPLILDFMPEILCIGSDWGMKYYDQAKLTQEWLDTNGVTFVMLPYTKEISSTLLRARINGTN